MINIFIDHPSDNRKSYIAQVSEEFAHPMVEFLDKTLPSGWMLEMDCWCDKICTKG